jgi:DNA-binding MarR family transcriptional regulator
MRRSRPARPGLRSGPAFLLAQIGAHAAARFAERLAPLGLTPPDAGILRILANEPGMTQRALAERLGIFPSRLVLLLDDLARSGWVERHATPRDRRSNALRLTKAGTDRLEAVGRVAREHQEDLCAGLDEPERARLQQLLEKIVTQQALTPGVHPGYRRMGR